MLRAAARAYADAVTLARAAAEIGMTVSGLHSFLGGTNPHRGTLRKLTAWYLARARENPDEVTKETVAAALDVLSGPLPLPLRRDARVALLKALQDVLSDARVPVPNWLASALEEASLSAD